MPQPSPALSWNAVATLTSLPFPRFWKPLPLGPAGWWVVHGHHGLSCSSPAPPLLAPCGCLHSLWRPVCWLCLLSLA